MQKMLIVGDTHGNRNCAVKVFNQARMRDCNMIVQVGDCGFWDHLDDGEFMDLCGELAIEYGIPFYWLDGNHENHPLLWSRHTERNEEGFIIVRPGNYYIPRGHIWTWGKTTFMGVGGAWSIDGPERRGRMSQGGIEEWWATEQLTEDDIAIALENLKTVPQVDIIFSHDAPIESPVPNILPLPESDVNRRKLSEIVNTAEPSKVYHGHYHVAYQYPIEAMIHRPDGDGFISYQVIGLGCDTQPMWQLVDTLEFE